VEHRARRIRQGGNALEYPIAPNYMALPAGQTRHGTGQILAGG
jgi:hypothetical protein